MLRRESRGFNGESRPLELKDLRNWSVLSETVWLALICMVDTALTIYLVKQGLAVESNPLLAWTFRYGTGLFVAAKIASFTPALVVIEGLRPRLGDFAKTALRLGIVGYLAFYFLGSIAVHTL
jgi:hypothetical protein